MAVLTLEHVSKTINRRPIIEDLSMQVEPGEVYGFLGPNGAGKTTTIRMIVGLSRPNQGQVKILGHDVQTDRRQALSYVGAIVENPEMYSYMSGRENLKHFARLSGIEQMNVRVDEVAEMVGLRTRLNEKVKRYSLGMRQRLGVAQALLAKPKLLVLDEPTNGLDPAGIREFREMMRNLALSGMSVFVSSHLLSEIQMMCDRVGVIKDGKMVVERSIHDLVTSGSDTVRLRVGDALAAKRVLDEDKWALVGVPGETMEVVASAQRIPALIRTLVAANVDVYAVEPVQETLEEAFLQLTDDAPADAGTDTNADAQQGGLVHA